MIQWYFLSLLLLFSVAIAFILMSLLYYYCSCFCCPISAFLILFLTFWEVQLSILLLLLWFPFLFLLVVGNFYIPVDPISTKSLYSLSYSPLPSCVPSLQVKFVLPLLHSKFSPFYFSYSLHMTVSSSLSPLYSSFQLLFHLILCHPSHIISTD